MLKQNYLIEIPGALLETNVQGEKHASNSSMIYQMEETRVRVPRIQIDGIRWLYDRKEHRWMKKNGHDRGSMVMSLPTKALQREVVTNGIVSNSMLYTAQLQST